MSQTNVEVVKRLAAYTGGGNALAYIRDDAAWAERSPERDAIFEPDCAFIWIGGGGREERTGSEGLRAGWLEFYEAWETIRTEYERIIPLGDKVLALARVYGRMTGSENEVENLGAAVYFVRDGRIACAEFYVNRAEALEAVGLRE